MAECKDDDNEFLYFYITGQNKWNNTIRNAFFKFMNDAVIRDENELKAIVGFSLW